MRKRIKIRITKTPKDFLKYASRPTCINHNIFGKNLVVIHEKKELLTLNKPIYGGCAVLELSKLVMYKFHYGFMKKEVDIFELLYSHTDSFIYEIIGENFHEIMHKFKELFDLSKFPKDSKYFYDDNKKLPRKMKDEYGGKIIYKFASTKPKMYSIQTVDKSEESIHKGHNSFIGYDQYEDVLFNKKVIRNNIKGMKSKNHKIFTCESNIISLCDFDDKRYIQDD